VLGNFLLCYIDERSEERRHIQKLNVLVRVRAKSLKKQSEKIQYHVVKNTLLQTAFSAIWPTGQRVHQAKVNTEGVRIRFS